MQKEPLAVDIRVGRNIRAMRLARSISQEQLGQKLGITFQQVQKYEKGTNRISASRLVQVCTALDCTLAQLFTGVETPELREGEQLSAAAMRAAFLFDKIQDTAQRRTLTELLKVLAEAPSGPLADGE